MPDVLRSATLKIRTPVITIKNAWKDPGESGQKYQLNLSVEQIEIQANGKARPNSSMLLGELSYNPAEASVASKTVTVVDPVTGQSVTISVAGISSAIEAWVVSELESVYPTE